MSQEQTLSPPVDFFALPWTTMAGAAHAAIVMVNAQQLIVAVNPAAQRMFGYAEADLLGQPLSRLIPEPQRAQYQALVQAFAASSASEHHTPVDGLITARHADGLVFPGQASIARAALGAGGLEQLYFVVMLHDASVECELRTQVQMLSSRLRAVLDLTPAAIWIVQQAQVVYANQAMLTLFGAAGPAQLVGQPVQALLQTTGPHALQQHLDSVCQGPPGMAQLNGRITRCDGQTREVELVSTALPDHGQLALQMVLTDVTETQLRLQGEEQHRSELRQLARYAVEAREEERRRIARELHDELGQRLTALKMALASSQPDLTHPEPAVAHMLEMVDDTVASVRRIAADLRPLMLDDLGLNSAIEWLARDAARHMDMEVTVQLEGDDPPLAPGADIAVYRMVQEALTNVGRHAAATDVRIQLRRAGGELVLTVHDNGKGFPARGQRPDGRFGLLGIRERAQMLGGRLTIDNPPAGGARITVHLPLAVPPPKGAAP